MSDHHSEADYTPWAFGRVDEEIRELRRRLGALDATLDLVLAADGRRGRCPDCFIGSLDGVTAGTALAAAFAGVRERLLVVRPGELPTDRWPGPSRSLLRRGGAVRLLYPHSLRSDRVLLGRLRPLLDDGAEVRTTGLPVVPLVVLDSAAAFVPAWLEIRHPALAGHLGEIFTAAWERASPLGPEPVPGTISEEVETAVARLLVAGHVDEAIARKLGMSVRACRRHVAVLCRRLGARSRAQLGFRLAASGLLDAPVRGPADLVEPAHG
ncbi:MAG: helix-turn-helix transcriptional regulator, partial [Spirillospora sp.]